MKKRMMLVLLLVVAVSPSARAQETTIAPAENLVKEGVVAGKKRPTRACQ